MDKSAISFEFRIENLFQKKIHNKETKMFRIGGVLLAAFYLFLLFDDKSNRDIGLYAVLGLLFILFIEISSITNRIIISPNSITTISLLTSKKKVIPLSEVTHFCFYETSVERYGYGNKLVIFLKVIEFATPRKIAIRLNFKNEENYKILSKLYKLGFEVLLFELLLRIEETEYYIAEG